MGMHAFYVLHCLLISMVLRVGVQASPASAHSSPWAWLSAWLSRRSSRVLHMSVFLLEHAYGLQLHVAGTCNAAPALC